MSDLKWYEKSGREGDVVISSRIRLARNLRDFPFPAKATQSQKDEIEKRVNAAVLRGNSVMGEEFEFLPLEKMSGEEAASLVEKHLASPEFIASPAGRALIASKDESVSIMINEEDHLRIQVLREGLSTEEAFETADRIDTLLNESLNFAFDKELGFLTQCPTNLGTGMRASIMLHLPALSENGAMPRLSGNLSKLGMTVRGTYGERTGISGAAYQISNQITLGLSEKEALENLAAIALQLISEERKAREKLVKNISVQDKIERAAGVLKSAKILSSQEFSELISYVKLGLAAGLISGVDFAEINGLSVKAQPATLSATEKCGTAEERDIKRAEIVRSALAGLH